MRTSLSADEIEQILRFALIGLVREDEELIRSGIHENAINSKLAFHLGQFFPVLNNNWVADVEYNRNIGEEKRNDKGLFRPDVVVHSRNSHANNLLYLEAKKKFGVSEFKADEHNVKYAMGNDFNYQCGAIVIYNWTQDRIWYAFYSKVDGRIRRRSDKFSRLDIGG